MTCHEHPSSKNNNNNNKNNTVEQLKSFQNVKKKTLLMNIHFVDI